MKVLHMVHSRTFAGTERHILGISRELRAMGTDVTIATPASAQAFRHAAQTQGFRVIGEWQGRLPRSFDVVHAHDGRSAIAARWVTARRESLFVRTQHFTRPATLTRTGLARELSLRAHRRINAALDGYVCVSEEARRVTDAYGEIRAPLAVIAPGIDVPDSDAWWASVVERRAAGPLTIVSAGRIEDERSFETLITALAQLDDGARPVRCQIAGAGPAVPRLTALAEDLGVADRLEWLGWVPDLQTVLRGAHLYVNTWPDEGFGMATAEAMAAGVPVVVPASGAAPELVVENESGWIVAPRDPAALASRLSELLTDPNRLARAGVRARERASARYSVASAAAALDAFYRSLLDRA